VGCRFLSENRSKFPHNFYLMTGSRPRTEIAKEFEDILKTHPEPLR